MDAEKLQALRSRYGPKQSQSAMSGGGLRVSSDPGDPLVIEALNELETAMKELGRLRLEVDSACGGLSEEDATYIRALLWPYADGQ